MKNPVSTSTSDEVAAPVDKGELQILNIKTEPKRIVANSLFMGEIRFTLFLTDVVPIINSNSRVSSCSSGGTSCASSPGSGCSWWLC